MLRGRRLRGRQRRLRRRARGPASTGRMTVNCATVVSSSEPMFVCGARLANAAGYDSRTSGSAASAASAVAKKPMCRRNLCRPSSRHCDRKTANPASSRADGPCSDIGVQDDISVMTYCGGASSCDASPGPRVSLFISIPPQPQASTSDDRRGICQEATDPWRAAPADRRLRRKRRDACESDCGNPAIGGLEVPTTGSFAPPPFDGFAVYTRWTMRRTMRRRNREAVTDSVSQGICSKGRNPGRAPIARASGPGCHSSLRRA